VKHANHLASPRRLAKTALSLAALASVLAASIVALPGAASAYVVSGSANLHASSGVLYSGCRDISYSFDMALPEGTQHWDITVSLIGPDGLEASSDYVYGSASDTTGGTGRVQVCGSFAGGRYKLTGELEYDDSDWVTRTVPTGAASITLRKPNTRTVLSASTRNPRIGQVVTLRTRATDERPNGYFGTDYAAVRIQKLAGGRWVGVAKVYTNTKGNGSTKMRFKSRKPVKLRAVTAATDSAAKSVSRTIKLR
jgi:hypothetical protein